MEHNTHTEQNRPDVGWRCESRELWRIMAAIRTADLRFESYMEDHLPTPEIIDQFWDWRDSFSGRPYFAMLNFMDAHAPYASPKRFQTLFGGGARKLDKYDGAIAYLDNVVGGIVEGLRKRGDSERTVIVVTADHGELFGEHGIEGHTPSTYPSAVRVPLILSGGPTPRGVRVAPPVSLRDIAAMILDVAAVTEARVERKPRGSITGGRAIRNCAGVPRRSWPWKPSSAA